MSITITQQQQAYRDTHTSHNLQLSAHQADLSEDCPVCPPQRRPNNDIASISVAQSQAYEAPPSHSQPSYWPELRGVPPYQAVDRSRDFSIRPLGSNGGERFFLVFMLSGVMVQNYANVIWRSTLGKLNKSWFQSKIGGEW